MANSSIAAPAQSSVMDVARGASVGVAGGTDGADGVARRRRAVIGAYALIGAAATIMTSAVALARMSVTSSLAPIDLLALRYGIGALLFAPILVRELRVAAPGTWKIGLPLSFAHGWGMSGCALIGLQLAPASHSGAIGTGVVPLWIAVLGWLLWRQKTTRLQTWGLLAIASGVVGITIASLRGGTVAPALRGDVFFVASSLLAACYFLYVERRRISARLGNALVMVASGLIVLPAYVAFFPVRLGAAPVREVLLQALVQGVLMPAAFFAIHRAVLELGGKTVAMAMAIVPVATLVTGRLIAGDAISTLEAFAVALVSAGVALGAASRQEQPAPPALRDAAE